MAKDKINNNELNDDEKIIKTVKKTSKKTSSKKPNSPENNKTKNSDEFLSNVKEKEIEKENTIKIVKEEPKIVSIREKYTKYVTDKKPFRVYLNGQIIYDNKRSNMEIQFFETYFILNNKKYEYKGIRIEKYNR